MQTSLARTVYVVDDDDAVRESLQMLLEVSGFEVEAFAAARPVLAKPPDHRVCCMLLDLNMPDLTGIELLASLRQLGVRTPVIIVTANSEKYADQIAQTDVVATIRKPIAEDIVGLVESVCACPDAP